MAKEENNGSLPYDKAKIDKKFTHVKAKQRHMVYGADGSRTWVDSKREDGSVVVKVFTTKRFEKICKSKTLRNQFVYIEHISGVPKGCQVPAENARTGGHEFEA